MTTLPFSRQIAAAVAAFLVSTACLIGAVGPAATNGSAGTVVSRSIA